MEATFISSNSFSVLGDKTEEFVENRRLKIDCGVDGTKYVKVVSSTFSSFTTVVVDESVLTSNIIGVLYGVVKPGDIGNLPDHFHTNTEGDGGYIEPPPLDFISLIDTPTTYSGTLNQYVISTGSGIEFQDLPEFSTTFLDLDDTPSTYSGTEGLYAKSTGSGIEWSEVIAGGSSDVQTFLDLTDTPSTYSGTYGMSMVSTGSGIEFKTFPVYKLDTTPIYTTEANIGDLAVDVSTNSIIEKKLNISNDCITSKSIIIDIADGWGGEYVGIRSVEFLDEYGLAIPLLSSDITCYSTTTDSATFYPPVNAFDTSKPKTGYNTYNQWRSARYYYTNQRLICVFNNLIDVCGIVINNSHYEGGYTNEGIKNIKIYSSTDTISSTVYNEFVTNGSLIFDGQVEVHVSADVVDDQNIDLDLPEPANGWDTVLYVPTTFLDLEDTPLTYSGTEGYFAKSTGSGVSWSEIKNNFIDLDDTPTTYSGISNRYLRTTASGIEAFDGIIVTSSGGYDWLIKVTDNGILYTEEL